MKSLCIYHGNCPDGFGAAWAVRNALGDAVEFYPGVHYSPPPDVTGREVIMVDFAYKLQHMETMLTQAKSVLVLDHHKSAAADLDILFKQKRIQGLFDMDRSGAMLAWDWFNPDQQPPRLLMHIQDRDLWRYELEFTQEVHAALSSYPYDFKVWDTLMRADLAQLVNDGVAIARRQDKDIREHIEIAKRRMVIAGHDVPALNVPGAWVSDAGNILAEGEPFAACYTDQESGRSFSLRSKDEGLDVSKIAVMFGGGGHRNAAGFKVPYDKDISIVPISENEEN